MGIIAVASCKKSSSGSASIVGTWKVTQYAIDVNGNAVLDNSEKITDTTNNKITFNNNGTGSIFEIEHGDTINLVFNWALENNNAWLRTVTTDTSGGTTSYDTSFSKIDALTSTSLTLRDTSSSPIQWTIFTKQ